MSLTKQDKEDIKEIMHDVIATDVTPRFDRLEAKMDSNHTINIKHHLQTWSMLGDLKQDHDKLREGLRNAAD